MNFNSSNQNKGGFNFKNMKSAFTSTLNQATQKSKELANKMKVWSIEFYCLIPSNFIGKRSHEESRWIHKEGYAILFFTIW